MKTVHHSVEPNCNNTAPFYSATLHIQHPLAAHRPRLFAAGGISARRPSGCLLGMNSMSIYSIQNSRFHSHGPTGPTRSPLLQRFLRFIIVL